jgi:hypothetical protein
MNAKILEQLKTKFSGVEESILKPLADKLAKGATEENLQTIIEGVTFAKILESYGDRRATEASATAVKNYETKHNLKDGKVVEQKKVEEPKPTDDVKPQKNEDMPEWAKQLIEDNQTLQNQVKAMQVGKITDTRRGEVAEIIKGLPEQLQKSYARIDLASMDEEAYSSFKEEITTEVKEISESWTQRGGIVTPPMGGQGKGGELTKAQIEAISHRVNSGGAEQQPF